LLFQLDKLLVCWWCD